MEETAAAEELPGVLLEPMKTVSRYGAVGVQVVVFFRTLRIPLAGRDAQSHLQP